MVCYVAAFNMSAVQLLLHNCVNVCMKLLLALSLHHAVPCIMPTATPCSLTQLPAFKDVQAASVLAELCTNEYVYCDR